jgi:hypothetical protein
MCKSSPQESGIGYRNVLVSVSCRKENGQFDKLKPN